MSLTPGSLCDRRQNINSGCAAFPAPAMSVSGFEARNNAEICGPVRPSSSASGFASPPVLSGNVALFPTAPLTPQWTCPVRRH